MTALPTLGLPLGLQSITDDMSSEQRCLIGIRNIELLCDIDWRGRLMLGAELTRMKWSGDFTRDKGVWRPDENTRGWKEWLKRRDFRLDGGDRPMAEETANCLIMWSVLYSDFVAVNESRDERGLLPLPLPTSVSQLRPYQSLMLRVDDWEPPQLDQPNAPTIPFEMQPPFAEHQPDVVAAWQEVFESIPPEQRTRKGELRPPKESESADYFRKQAGLKQLAAREKQEIEKAKEAALAVGEKPADPAKQAAAAAPPRTKAKPKPAPKKSAAELEAERRAYQIQQDVRDYRLKMNNLQQSAEALEAFIKSTLAREGSEEYLQTLRKQEAGIYSVTDDVSKLRDAVVVCQSIYTLITEVYQPPEPISRRQASPSEAVIDL
nr:hypothetical protein [uncultured Mediterranean phage uvMED]